MTERRGSRFLLEVLFLVALAGALTLADVSAFAIAGIMLLGWVIVAALEWAAWRGQPHYGSGLPPRYYVPSTNLPPAQPLEQVSAGYPGGSRDEAPTWIAPAELRAEVLGEWPVAGRAADPPPPPVSAPAHEAVGEEDDEFLTVVRLPPAPELPEPELEPEPLPAAVAEPGPSLDVVLQRSAQRVARYSLDPLAEPPPKRRFGRGAVEGTVAALEVPARPEGVRPLPGRSSRQD